MFKGVVQQHPVMSWDELRARLDLLLVESVREGPDGQPYVSELRKADRQSGEIMQLFQQFLEGRS
jgi:hypothetical protein